jgi:predicted metalloprotease with PDZ domain
LTPGFVTEHDLLKRVSKKVLSYGRGVGAEIEMTVTRAKALQLGGIFMSNCLTLLPERGQYGGPAGNVGSRLLRRYRVIFDYVHQEMILEPNNLFALPEEFDMSGLAFVAASGGFRVEHVLPNSPAAEAGIQPGDLIEGVNDRPTVGMDIAELRGLFRHAGSEYDLIIRRGGESNKSHLRLRRLI